MATYQPGPWPPWRAAGTAGPSPTNLIGQPNVRAAAGKPSESARALSFLAYGTFHGDVRGLAEFPPDTWPNNMELLYYSFHIMAGLGTLCSASWRWPVALWRGTLARGGPCYGP